MKTISKPLCHAQRGVLILLMFAILFMAGASVFIAFASNNVVGLQNNDQSVDALQAAKATLIAYAVLHGEHYGAAGAGPGHLPCPDTNGDGVENLPCGNNALGRIPQSVLATNSGDTIVLSDYNFGIDQQLWYGLANPARRTPVSAFNSTTATTHTLDGQANMAAILIAPGAALSSQSRPSNNRANYLEGSNAAGTAFITNNGQGPTAFNDRAVGITVEEIMIPVTARVAEAIKLHLDSYHDTNATYPDAVDFATEMGLNSPPAWLATNDWISQANYTLSSADTIDVFFNGCTNITYTLDHIAGTITRAGSRC